MNLYRYVDAALLRASATTSTAIPPSWPDLNLEAGVDQWRWRIGQLWSSGAVAEAIAVASPTLADRVDALVAGHRMDAAQVRRIAFSLARYLVRMRGRATPFGLFAGVAPIRFGRPAAIREAGVPHRSVRADALWLASVIARLESNPALRDRLHVVSNDLAVVRGDRLVVAWRPHPYEPGHRPPAEASLRYTRPVQTALQAAGSPILVGDLAAKLAADYPAAGRRAADPLVAELLTVGVLVSNLRPPSTTVDGLGHVLQVLRGVGGSGVSDAATLTGELGAIYTDLQASGQAWGARGSRGEPAVAGRMRALTGAAGPPLTVDLRLGDAVVVPERLAVEAEAAAGALLRLSAAPAGMAAWRRYHARFLGRYGPGAVVPVTQLVDATAGLGYPCHYPDPGPARVADGCSRRDERLLVLAQQAALDGAHEVMLDDEAIDALAGEEAGEPRPVPHLDLCVEVRAASAAALGAGEFTLVVSGIGQTAIATSGRFLYLLPEHERQRFVEHYAALPVGVESGLAAQVSFAPHHPRVENVIRVPQVLPAVISLGEHRDGGRDQVDVRDLAVTADRDRMYVLSVSRRRVVEPTLTCAAARHTMPPLARLLVEVPRASCAPVALFDWGAAACLPFRPRLRYRRTILTPARWRIPAGALPDPAAPRQVWTAAMTALRRRLRLPAWVFAGTGDRRLRLDLDDPVDLALLRAYVDGTVGPAIITEACSPAEHGWIQGRAHELVIPLASTTEPASAPAVLARRGPLPLIGREHALMPGSSVLSAKLYGDPDAASVILTDHLPALLAGWEQPPLWWFVRYRDPVPHLRIRLRTPDYGTAAARVGAWASELRRCGLIGELTLDTYRPEIARYGDGAAMAAAEQLFAADSTAAAAQLAARATAKSVDPYALTAVSLTDLASALLGHRQIGMGWLIDHPELATPVALRDRSLLRQAIDVADLDADDPAPPGMPGVVASWQARRQAATAYARRLAEHAIGVRPLSVVGSLLHLHHIRVHGIDNDVEARTYRLARSVALAYTARRTATPGNAR